MTRKQGILHTAVSGKDPIAAGMTKRQIAINSADGVIQTVDGEGSLLTFKSADVMESYVDTVVAGVSGGGSATYPDQTGQGGKILGTDGADVIWVDTPSGGTGGSTTINLGSQVNHNESTMSLEPGADKIIGGLDLSGGHSVAHVKKYVPGDTVSDIKWDFDTIDSAQWDGGSVDGGKIGLTGVDAELPSNDLVSNVEYSANFYGIGQQTFSATPLGGTDQDFYFANDANANDFPYTFDVHFSRNVTAKTFQLGSYNNNQGTRLSTFDIEYWEDGVWVKAQSFIFPHIPFRGFEIHQFELDARILSSRIRIKVTGSSDSYAGGRTLLYAFKFLDESLISYNETTTVTSLSSVNTSIATAINSINVTETKPAGTDIKYALSFDGKATWSTPVNRVGFEAFDFSSITLGDSLDVQLSLSTTDYTVTPTVDQISVDMATMGTWNHISLDPALITVYDNGVDSMTVVNNSDSAESFKVGVETVEQNPTTVDLIGYESTITEIDGGGY